MSDAPVAADLRFMREVNTTAILERLRGCTQMSVTELAANAAPAVLRSRSASTPRPAM